MNSERNLKYYFKKMKSAYNNEMKTQKSEETKFNLLWRSKLTRDYPVFVKQGFQSFHSFLLEINLK